MNGRRCQREAGDAEGRHPLSRIEAELVCVEYPCSCTPWTSTGVAGALSMIDTVRDWERSARCRDSVRCFASCVSTASPRRVKAVSSRGGGEERALSYSNTAPRSLRWNSA